MALTEKNIRNIVIYAAPLFAGYGLTILTLPVLTRLLTPHEFGIVALAWAFPTLAVGIVTCGLSSAVQRYYFELRTDQRKLDALIFSSQLFLYLALILSAGIVFLLKERISQLTMLSPEYGTAVFVAYVAAYFGQIIGFYLLLYQNMEHAGTYTSFTLLQSVITLSTSLLLVWHFKLSYMGMIYGTLAGNLVVSLVLLLYFNRGRKTAFQGPLLFEALRYGLQVVPKSFTGFVNRFFDKYLLNNMLSLSAVGVYNIGQTVGNSLFVLMNTVWSSFQPACYKEVFDKGTEASASTGRLFTLFCYLSLTPLLLLVLFAQEIVAIIAPPSYYAAIDLIIILAGGTAVQVFGMYVGVQYAYSKKAYWIFPLTVIGTLLNVAANLLLIPRYGLLGGGLSTVLTSVLLNGMLAFVGQRLYRIRYEWRSIIQLFSIILFAIITVLYLRMTGAGAVLLYGMKAAFLALFIIAGVSADIITRRSFDLVSASLFRYQKK